MSLKGRKGGVEGVFKVKVSIFKVIYLFYFDKQDHHVNPSSIISAGV